MTTKKLHILLMTALVPLMLTACGKKEEPQPQPLKKAAPAKPAAAAAPATVDQQASVEPTVEGRRRNPFQSHIILMKGMEGAKKIRGPLECCELSSFKVVALVVSPDNSFALIQAPDGKRYVVRKGDVLGSREGRIIRIDSRSLTVREIEREDDGKIRSSVDVELMLPVDKDRR